MKSPYLNPSTKKVYSKSSKGMYSKKYSDKDLFKGTKVEFEHTPNRKEAEKIARTHLEENPDYYKYYNPQSKNPEYLIN